MQRIICESDHRMKSKQKKLRRAIKQTSKQLIRSPIYYLTVKLTANQQSGLFLPASFKSILADFQFVDNSVHMRASNKQLCTFDNLAHLAQSNGQQSFTLSTLSLLVTLHRTAFRLYWLKRTNGSVKWDLIVEASREATTDMISPEKRRFEESTKGSHLCRRRAHFHQLLLTRVMDGHRRFLMEELGFSADDLPPVSKIMRWHPQFPVTYPSKWIPEVGIAADCIPASPEEQAHHQPVTSVEKVVEFMRQRQTASTTASPVKGASPQLTAPPPPPSLLSCAVNLSLQVDFRSGRAQQPSVTTSAAAAMSFGVSEVLMNKIRERTEMKKQQLRRRNLLLGQLPEMATLIWSIVMRQKNTPIAHSLLISKLADSHSQRMNAASVEEHLKVLLEILPDWLDKKEWAEPHYFLLQPRQSLADIHQRITSSHSLEQ